MHSFLISNHIANVVSVKCFRANYSTPASGVVFGFLPFFITSVEASLDLLHQLGRAPVNLPATNEVVCDAHDEDQSEDGTRPIHLIVSFVYANQLARLVTDQFISAGPVSAMIGKKLITVASIIYRNDRMLMGTPQRPRDQRAGGSGAPKHRRHRTQAMLKA